MYAEADKFQASMIKELPCIPVHSDLLAKDIRKVVLVKPSSVLAYECSIDDYRPFLHSVPLELMCLMTLLTELGVKQNLDLHHMQIVLEKIFVHSEGAVLDPNSIKCVQKALEFLNSRLFSAHASGRNIHVADSLTPLYLPDTNDVLKLSTAMLYCDTHSYYDEMELDLKGTPYSHFDVSEDTYGVNALDICRLLPEQVRPLGMSIKCKQVPSEDCETIDHSDLSLSIEDSLQYHSNSLAVVKLYKKFIPNQVGDNDLEHFVTEFFSLKIYTKQNLQTQIILRESNKEIGFMKSNFYLQCCESPYVLYIDHSCKDDDEIITEIAEQLCHDILEKFPTDSEVAANVKNKFVSIMVKYFKAESSKKPDILRRFRLEIKGKPSKFKIELGERIPDCYHRRRLDQDIYNIFYPMEYVGFEETEDHIIVAQIVHLVQSEDDRHHAKKYLIYTRKDDEEGRVVSILDIYKFLKGTKRASKTVESLAVVPYAEDNDATNLRRSIYEGGLSDIQERIRTELKEIWKLDNELRKKAIRRLYLKWHPDKNLDNTEMAEEVFTFLTSEINRLSSAEADSNESFRSRGGSVTEFNFRSWNRTARRQREAHQEEEVHAADSAGPDPSPFDTFTNPKLPQEGWRWVEQAETDFKVLCEILSVASNVKGYAHVCFVAHQVVEKALKGGVYALCGMDGRGLTDHNLIRHAYALQTAVPGLVTQYLAMHSIPLESYYLDTRYPNRWAGYADTPSDHFTMEQASKAKGHAEAVLDAVKEIMPQL